MLARLVEPLVERRCGETERGQHVSPRSDGSAACRGAGPRRSDREGSGPHRSSLGARDPFGHHVPLPGARGAAAAPACTAATPQWCAGVRESQHSANWQYCAGVAGQEEAARSLSCHLVNWRGKTDVVAVGENLSHLCFFRLNRLRTIMRTVQYPYSLIYLAGNSFCRKKESKGKRGILETVFK